MTSTIEITLGDRTELAQLNELSEKIRDACEIDLQTDLDLVVEGNAVMFGAARHPLLTCEDTDGLFVADLLSDHVLSGTAFVTERTSDGHSRKFSVTPNNVTPV